MISQYLYNYCCFHNVYFPKIYFGLVANDQIYEEELSDNFNSSKVDHL